MSFLITQLNTYVRTNKYQELWFASVDKIIDLKDNALRYNMYITNNLEKLVNSEYYKLTNDY